MIQQNKIKYSQLALLLCLIIPAGKFMHLPMVLHDQCGSDLWLGYIALFAVDIFCLIGILWAATINKGQLNIKEILQKTVGIVVADVILGLLALFFFIKFTVILLDFMSLCNGTFIIKSNWPIFAALMFVALFFVLKSGFGTIGRLAQIVFVPVILSLVAIIALSVSDGDFDNLFPVLKNGFEPVAKGAFDGCLLFADGLFIMLAFGDLTYEKKGNSQVLIAFAAGSFLTVALSVVYVALFGELASEGSIAISRVSQFNISSSAVGRLDWLLIAIWLSAILMHLFTLAFCFNKCLKLMFDTKQSKFNIWLFLVLCVAVIVVPLVLDMKEFILQPQNWWLRAVLIVVVCVLPLILPLLSFFANKKENADNGKDTKRKFVLDKT